MKFTFRSFQSVFYRKDTPSSINLLRNMVANEKDFEKFKVVQNIADRIGVRFHFRFPPEEADKIVLTMSDSKRLPPDYARTTFLNRFKRRKNQVEIPTMTHHDANWILYDDFNVFGRKSKYAYPVETAVFDPKKPYIEIIAEKLRAISTKFMELAEADNVKLKSKHKL